MSQVHKRNAHSGRASNVAVNRAWKRALVAQSKALANRVSRRAVKRQGYAASWFENMQRLQEGQRS